MQIYPIMKSNYSKQDFNGHIAFVHERKKPFECYTCGASFARSDQLKKLTKTWWNHVDLLNVIFVKVNLLQNIA